MYTKRRPLVERFWERVDRRGPNECWPWTGCVNEHGYGLIGRGGRKCKIEKAHRVAWELHNGPIPDGVKILHRCDNPPCCNESHLFTGTQGDNHSDMMAKGRHGCGRMQGESHHQAKLTDDLVLQIRNAKGSGPKIAAKYGVSSTQVYNIKSGRSWKHV